MALSTDTSGMEFEEEFEVFLSFRGPDTRVHFTSYLYHDMVEKGIRVFRDDKELNVGEKIEELFKALNDSQIYIPIFSEDFASSPWCLREVVGMVDCAKNSNGKKEILPIFLVKPEDVKSSTGSYSNALSKLEKEKAKYGDEEEKLKYDPDEVKSWRDALREVASRVGWKLEGLEGGELIKLIVQEVLLKLKVKNRYLPDDLVEMDDEKEIEELLKVDSVDDVRFVIIYGTGGIGKTTLAKIIFNRFRSKFDYYSFLDDVQDSSQGQHLLHKQKKLLSDTLGSTSADGIKDTNEGIYQIRRGLHNKKVLVVVDNVNKEEQLNKLAGSYKWFGPGSRIIVTLRDRRTVLNWTRLENDKQMQPNHYIEYPVKEMPIERAVQLFSWHAFRRDTPSEDWCNFSFEVVSHIGRLPLTLQLMGSLFANTVKSKWDETFKDLKQVPCKEVRETLMISVNKLDAREKQIFLDIACFCIGENEKYAYYMWDDCKFSPHNAINNLRLMSLIKINEHDNTFWMHDEVRDLGRYIANKENVEDAGNCHCLVIDQNNVDILRRDEEKGDVRALTLAILHDLTPEDVAYLPKLRFLRVDKIKFVGDFKNCLRNLRWLSWQSCSSDFLATNLHLVNLVVLDLSQSHITHKWGGWRHIEMAKKLKVLNLSKCILLTKTPNISEFGKLEKLILKHCRYLHTIDSSIGKVKLLNTLDIEGCESLKGLPKEISSLEHLSEIIIPYIKDLPETLGNLKSLMKLTVRHGISRPTHPFGRNQWVLLGCINLRLLDSIGELESLVELNLKDCYLHKLSNSIGMLKKLKYLILSGCKNLCELPNSIGNLESLVKLDLNFSGISFLPDSIGRLKKLEHLLLFECNNLNKLPDSVGELESLVKLDLKFSRISVLPNSIGRLKNLKHLSLSECKNLYEFPDFIWELDSSIKLDLKFFSGYVIHDSIGRLMNFTHLSLSKCGNLFELAHSGEQNSLVKLDFKLLEISTFLKPIRMFTSFTHLSLSGCKNLYELPDSIGQMKRLKVLNVAYTKIRTIPKALGGVETLEELDASFCLHLKDDLKDEWEMLSSTRLRILNLYRSPISIIPRNINDFSSLQTLKIASHRLSPLPKLPLGLKCLVVEAAEFPVLPELSSLVHLHHLEVRKEQCMTFRMPNEVTSPWKDVHSINRLPLSLSTLKLHTIPQLPDFSVFQSLLVLSITGCLMPRMPDLLRLKRLQELRLSDFPELVEIPGLGELESLMFLHISMCNVIELLPNLSKLKNLRNLELKHCAKLRAVEGLKELNSLTKAEIQYCMSLEKLPDVPELTELKTDCMAPEAEGHTIRSTVLGKRLQLW